MVTKHYILKTKDRARRPPPLKNRGVNSGTPKGYAFLAPHVTSVVVLILLQTRGQVTREERTGL